MKIIQTIIFLLFSFTVLSQKNKVQSAWRALNDYESTLNEKADLNYLIKAQSDIDLAAENEETKNQVKTHAYRFRIYTNLFLSDLKAEESKVDTSIFKNKSEKSQIAYGNVSIKNFSEAENSIGKIKQIDEKFIENIMKGVKDSEDDRKFLSLYMQLNSHLANIASGRYKTKKYEEAADFFETVAISNSTITGKTDTANFYNACISAQKSKNFNKIIQYNKKMIELNIATAYNFQTIYDAKLLQNDSIGSLEYLINGRKLFPDDVYLLNRETEIYLKKGDQENALANLQKAIEKDPKNPQLQLVLGNVYDNLANPKGKNGKDTTKPADFDNLVMKAAEHYQKAIDLRPSSQESYYNALYNMGALYNNYGGALYNKSIEKVTLTDIAKKQKEYEAKSAEYYKKAIPYLEQALTIKTDDKACIFALRKLYFLIGNEAEGKKMSDKLKSAK
ncbi:MAG: tetratricopeptide repeat protein [Bacteroidota bacterium]